jgi:hypothetical protein
MGIDLLHRKINMWLQNDMWQVWANRNTVYFHYIFIIEPSFRISLRFALQGTEAGNGRFCSLQLNKTNLQGC